ncbi:GNAT family N-acetyltransferase [Candidatus Micrarchaeota archaeon]|nr:GNAT family N-acetyltransferase [Candidatus Micrarchaeota archaeon]
MRFFFEDFFGKAASKEYWKTYSSHEKRFFFAVVENKKIIGTVCLRIGYKVAGIGAFAVAASRRKEGIGLRLLEKCEQLAKKYKCKKIWLWTLPTIPAYSFYKHNGYVEEARLKKHFAGQDLCVMSKFL